MVCALQYMISTEHRVFYHKFYVSGYSGQRVQVSRLLLLLLCRTNANDDTRVQHILTSKEGRHIFVCFIVPLLVIVVVVCNFRWGRKTSRRRNGSIKSKNVFYVRCATLIMLSNTNRIIIIMDMKKQEFVVSSSFLFCSRSFGLVHDSACTTSFSWFYFTSDQIQVSPHTQYI